MPFDSAAKTINANVELLAQTIETRESLRAALLDDNYVITQPNYFSMESYGSCGSPRCIAGWAAELFGGWIGRDGINYGVIATALEVDRTGLYALCHPDYMLSGEAEEAAWEATPKQAANTLRHFAMTGEINWDISEPD